MSTTRRLWRCGFLLGCLVIGTGARAAVVRSMWVWNTADIVGDADQTKELLDFCGERQVRALFVWAPDVPHEDYARWQAFIGAAHDDHVAVHALAGDPSWADRPQLALTHVARVVSYNSSVPNRAGFDGVQHDVSFSENARYRGQSDAQKASVVSLYLEGVRASHEALGKLASNLKYGVTVPPGLRDTFEWRRILPGSTTPEVVARPLYEHIMECADYTVLLAFHDSADAIAQDATDEVRYATRHGKLTYLGVLTGTPEGYPADTTFAQEGRAKLESAIAAVTKQFAQERGFRGFVIHDYASYRELGP